MTVRYSASQNQAANNVTNADKCYEAGFYATTANLTLYIDPAGDDTLGDGSALHPYRQPARAFQDIGRKIRHQVRILASPGTYDWPETCVYETEEGGSLSIIGAGADTVVSGPHTVGVVSAIGLGGMHCTVPADTWVADEKLGLWVRIAEQNVPRVSAELDRSFLEFPNCVFLEARVGPVIGIHSEGSGAVAVQTTMQTSNGDVARQR